MRTAPTLRLAGLAPVKVAGKYFQPRERVQLVASIDGTKIRRVVRASRLGAFSVIFVQIDVVDRCASDLFVRAIGGLGSRAAVKLPQPQCPPGLSPP